MYYQFEHGLMLFNKNLIISICNNVMQSREGKLMWTMLKLWIFCKTNENTGHVHVWINIIYLYNLQSFYNFRQKRKSLFLLLQDIGNKIHIYIRVFHMRYDCFITMTTIILYKTQW